MLVLELVWRLGAWSGCIGADELEWMQICTLELMNVF